MVVRRPGEGLHLGTGLDETLPRDLGKGLAADHGIVHLLVQEHLNRLPELQGGGIKVPKGPEPLLLAFGLRIMNDIGDEQIKQIKRIIQGDLFEGMGKGEQGG